MESPENLMVHFKKFLLFLLFPILLASCSGLNRNYSTGSRYDDPYYPGYYSRGDDYYRERERERLDRERRDLERDRRRLEREKEKLDRQKSNAYKRPKVQDKPETCPSGFRPGRCSKKDRKHGCRDMRTPGGLGCRT